VCMEELNNNEDDETNEDHTVNQLFVNASTVLLKDANQALATIEELKVQLLDHQNTLALFLCEDPATFKQDVVIKELHDFSKLFTKIRTEDKRQRLAKERRKKLQEERELKATKVAEKRKSMQSNGGGGGERSSPSSTGNGGDSGGGGNVNRLLDGMLHRSFMSKRGSQDGKTKKTMTASEKIQALSKAMHGEIDEEVSSDDDWDDDSD
jgi:hypothetical protein